MALPTYIPTGGILDALGLDKPFNPGFEHGRIAIKEDIPAEKLGIKPDAFNFQYNPEEIGDIDNSANWAVMSAPGEKPTLHYVGSGLKSMPLRLIFDNDFDESDKKYLANNFQGELNGVMEWFYKVTQKTTNLDRPPRISVSFGTGDPFICVVTELRTRILKAYPNLIPRMIEINATLLEVN